MRQRIEDAVDSNTQWFSEFLHFLICHESLCFAIGHENPHLHPLPRGEEKEKFPLPLGEGEGEGIFLS